MADRLPLLSGKEIVKVLAKLGYGVVRQTGSHMRLQASGRNPITIPNYKQIDRSLLRKILRDAKLSTKEFNDLHRR